MGKFVALLPKWNEIKNESDALKKNGAFKPDITPVIKKYDQFQKDFTDLEGERDKLPDIMISMMAKTDGINPKYSRLNEKRSDIIAEDSAKFDEVQAFLNKAAKDPLTDQDSVLSEMNKFIVLSNDSMNMVKALNDQLTTLDAEYLSIAKKTRDEYKSKWLSLKSRWEGLQSNGKSLKG